MNAYRTCRLRIVAIETSDWISPEPPPIMELAYNDLIVPDIMLLFAEDQLRYAESDPNFGAPRMPSDATLEGPVLQIGDVHSDLRSAVYDDPRPDYIIAHGATGLRALLSPNPTGGKWLCTHRIARQVWPDAPGYGLKELTTWLGLHPPANPDRNGWLGSDTIVAASLTALLLIDLLKKKSICSLQVLSTNFQFPFAEAPNLGDAIGWAQVPDDDLTWLSRVSEASLVRERALLEMGRRWQHGLATPLLGQPPVHYGDEGRIAALS